MGWWVAAAVLLAQAATPGSLLDDTPRGAYPLLGAPHDPKVTVAWNRIYDVAGIHRILEEIARAHPELAHLVEVGESFERRKIRALEVTSYAAGEPTTKPAIYIDGNIHGNEVQAAEAVLYTAWYLTESYGKVDGVTRLLDERAFYLVPTINPDGRDHWLEEPNTPHSSRGGRIPVDNDGDGRLDEDGPEDLDGDGHITQMRVEDPWGRWKPHPDYPEYLMLPAERDERGTYRMLGWEGIDNDGDGKINEDPPGGYDPNRNWPWDWQPEAAQWGSKDYPLSLPETRAVAEYVLARPNIAAAQTFHNFGGMILRPPGVKARTVDKSDDALAAFIAERGEAMLPNYRSMVTGQDLYSVWGGESDWFYGALGVISFTNEIFPRGLDSPWEGEPDDNAETRARFLRHLLQDEGLTPWHEVEHPDLGRVEVGGTAKSFGRVPPSFLMEEQLHRNMAFTLYHAESMPLVRLGEVEVERISGSLARVRVPVENHGIIPTRLAHDVAHGITSRNTVTLQGEGLTVLAGGPVADPLHDRVDWQEIRPERVMLEKIPGLGRTFVEFLVEGRGTARVRVQAARGGTVERSIELD